MDIGTTFRTINKNAVCPMSIIIQKQHTCKHIQRAAAPVLEFLTFVARADNL